MSVVYLFSLYMSSVHILLAFNLDNFVNTQLNVHEKFRMCKYYFESFRMSVNMLVIVLFF